VTIVRYYCHSSSRKQQPVHHAVRTTKWFRKKTVSKLF